MKFPRHLATLLLSCLICAPASSQHIPEYNPMGLTGDFSGSWYNPEQSGHGLFVEVLDGGRAAVAWFTFDPQGRPAWLYGVLDLGDWKMTGTLSTVAGGHFPPAFDPEQVVVAPWGSIEIEVAGCDTAELRWQALDPAYGGGSLPLSRLTALQGQRCMAEEQFVEQRSYFFERGAHQFTPLFVDLPAQGQDIYELDFDYETLPDPLGRRRGLRLTGHNRSDDLAMLITAPVGGLLPDRVYRAEVELELASNVPSGCAGVGGSPGDSVYVKLGVVGQKPEAVAVDEGPETMLRANIDIGSQSQDGPQVHVVGTLANRQSCEDLSAAQWQLKTLVTTRPLAARSDAEGRIWVLAGTDSAFEGLTEYYLTALRLRLLLQPEF